ncbi:MAG: hypothetical protein JXB88_03185 [Spirochaetales bacterium]|nr:hypothetical protein [Spirochaetales bacterium]
MGTHSVTRFYDEDKKFVFAFYKQFDGYPEEHGRKLHELLYKKTAGNTKRKKTKFGYNTIQNLSQDIFNSFRKDYPGECCETDEDNYNIEYYYDIQVKDKRLYITITQWYTPLYHGLLDEMPVEDKGQDVNE